jgi:hypothetical protein
MFKPNKRGELVSLGEMGKVECVEEFYKRILQKS